MLNLDYLFRAGSLCSNAPGGAARWIASCGRNDERRHCEEQIDEAIQSFFARQDGLLRCARNDDYFFA